MGYQCCYIVLAVSTICKMIKSAIKNFTSEMSQPNGVLVNQLLKWGEKLIIIFPNFNGVNSLIMVNFKVLT